MVRHQLLFREAAMVAAGKMLRVLDPAIASDYSVKWYHYGASGVRGMCRCG